MHAPIERKSVGVQGEPDVAVQRWLRTQIAPCIERSIEAFTGKRVRKPPVGLRGKYYPDYRSPDIAKRFQVNTWGYPFYLWRTVNGVRVRSVLPEPKDAPKRVGNVIIIPHVPQGKSAGDRPVMPAGWTIDWQLLPDRSR